ncbi:MAG: dihydropteroate synthase [bacterium]|nr:dihydropteroate synthase [bacterium]MCM1374142.1 dihydropteroate synthase [Muribaculum sp.]
MRIGSREFDVENRTYVMGILNVTPDSFSDGGKWNCLDSALWHVEEMLAEGMDILDIGGESTRPGTAYNMSVSEELERVMPYIEAVKGRFDVPVSLDTYKSQVAEAGIAAGVDLINDIWGLKWDCEMARVIADSGVACCLMHNRRRVERVSGGEQADEFGYESFLEDVASDLVESVRLARQEGISEERILLDPGVGFAKTYEQNLQILHHLETLRALGYPLLLGTSRKSVVGLTLDLPVTERLEGTLATTVIGVLKGCSFVRVHDVKENVRVIHMTRAILEEGKPSR